MTLSEIVVSQYLAALAMLRAAVEACPKALWNDPADRNRFWHVAYHVLFYTHLYAGVDEAAFAPWEGHREEHGSLDQLPEGAEPYTKAEVLAYLDWLGAELPRMMAAVDLTAEASGFYWLPMNKLELQFYSIRHVQQHAGELCERLGSRAGFDVDWVGMVHGPPSMVR